MTPHSDQSYHTAFHTARPHCQLYDLWGFWFGFLSLGAGNEGLNCQPERGVLGSRGKTVSAHPISKAQSTSSYLFSAGAGKRFCSRRVGANYDLGIRNLFSLIHPVAQQKKRACACASLVFCCMALWYIICFAPKSYYLLTYFLYNRIVHQNPKVLQPSP